MNFTLRVLLLSLFLSAGGAPQGMGQGTTPTPSSLEKDFEALQSASKTQAREVMNRIAERIAETPEAFLKVADRFREKVPEFKNLVGSTSEDLEKNLEEKKKELLKRREAISKVSEEKVKKVKLDVLQALDSNIQTLSKTIQKLRIDEEKKQEKRK